MMSGVATTSPSRPAGPYGRVRRDTQNGKVAGVCAGIGKRMQVDPLLVRLAFVATALASGIGLVVYVLAWILMPVEEAEGDTALAAIEAHGRRGTVEVALGAGLLLLAVLLAFRELGLPFSDVLVWPLTLVAAGGALIWHRSTGSPAAVTDAAAPPRAALTAHTTASAPAAATAPTGESRPAVISRIGIGVTLVIAAAVVFLQITGALAAATDVALAALVVAIAFGVIFAPWFVRLARSLTAERAERIRSQERAEVAAHLHDSVLQTLALVQKRAGDPREVAALARRQERELRAWLSSVPAHDAGERWLVAELESAAQEVEEAHGVPIDVVAVGDARLDRDGEALVAAAREAMLNAAKFAGGGAPVAVYAEAGDERLQVFVRDRGPGFDPSAVATDRRGVRESIVGRMERHGGRAEIHASPGGGTEVELVLERSAP
jgi:signal transduction histidine kinase